MNRVIWIERTGSDLSLSRIHFLHGIAAVSGMHSVYPQLARM